MAERRNISAERRNVFAERRNVLLERQNVRVLRKNVLPERQNVFRERKNAFPDEKMPQSKAEAGSTTAFTVRKQTDGCYFKKKTTVDESGVQF